ncbi:unnamed protein product [Lactuca saligna]|uniref:PHD finger protein ALFIN-LIKE n=1 Tax=Lactuca saligna TaxID=75948 RepID=A0AA35VQ06_LACSI|nr:unnamed protein product [Lactuca saligna]
MEGMASITLLPDGSISVRDKDYDLIKTSIPLSDQKRKTCLYGFPSEQWEVNLPTEEVPPELPEHALGINFACDGMPENDWLSLAAVHSDVWLLFVVCYFCARFGFDKSDRDDCMGDVSLRKTGVEDKRAKVQKESKILLDYTRKAIARLTYLKRTLSQLEDDVAPCEA